MLTKGQAQAVADALLDEKRAEQAALHARTQQRQSASRNWAGAGALLGLAAGGLIGYYAAGHAFPWNLFGMGVGAAIGSTRDRRAA